MYYGQIENMFFATIGVKVSILRSVLFERAVTLLQIISPQPSAEFMIEKLENFSIWCS